MKTYQTIRLVLSGTPKDVEIEISTISGDLSAEIKIDDESYRIGANELKEMCERILSNI